MKGCFRLRHGVLATDDPAVDAALGPLIASCIDPTVDGGGPGGSLEVPRGPGRAPLGIEIAPFRMDAATRDFGFLGLSRPVATLVITDPEHKRESRKRELRKGSA